MHGATTKDTPHVQTDFLAWFNNGLRFEGGWGRRPKGGDPGSAACGPGARGEPPATPRPLPAKERK